MFHISSRLTLMSLDTERMRRRVSSDSKIIPSMQWYKVIRMKANFETRRSLYSFKG
jgi:hypothetical protein